MDNASRAVFRGQVTKIANSATEYLSSPECQVNSKNLDHFDSVEEDLIVFIQRLTVARENLSKANEGIKPTVKPDDLQKEVEAIAEYDDKAISVIARLQQRLVKWRETQNLINGTSMNAQPLNGISRENQNSAKLPKLFIKSFSGDFKDWLPFWERFKTTVHERRDLTGADKFNYLQSHLSGKAADSIMGFTPSNANYDAAVSMLQEEYGNNERLVDFSMQQLMSLPRVYSRHDVDGLRRLYNTITSTTRSLTTLGVQASTYSIMLKSIILKCMPQDLTVEFHRSYVENEVNAADTENNDSASVVVSDDSSAGCGDQKVREILKFLKREVESLEKSAQLQTRRSISQTNVKTYKTAAGLLTPTPNEYIACFFCRSHTHSTQRCNAGQSVSERKNMLKRDGRCFRCTRRGHSSKSCTYKHIKCDKCSGHHASAMCDPCFNSNKIRAQPTISNDKTTSSGNNKSSNLSANLCSTASQPSSDVYLQTACVYASSTDRSKMKSFIRIILDGGSQRSYIRESLAKKLKLKEVDEVNICISPFGTTKSPPKKSLKRVRVVLQSQHDMQEVIILAIMVPEICLDILPVPSNECPMFSQYVLADDDKGGHLESGINMLLGADYLFNVVCEESCRVSENLVMIKTAFGWTVQGPIACNFCENNAIVSATMTTLCANNEVDIDLKRFWDLETLGICNNSDIEQSTISDEWFKYINKNGKRYEASLLWKNRECELDSHKVGALQRFDGLIYRLCRDPQKLIEYDNAMWELISSKVAEEVDESKNSQFPIYYMPHRPVYRHDKTTTPVRIVFDASARTGNNRSLNDWLNTGPNLLPNVLTILLNFRLGKYCLVADIEKAFLQVALACQDRDAHRFFWFKKRIDNTEQLPERTIYRMTRVTFGVACSPFLLCATLKRHLDSEFLQFPQTCKQLQTSFYMDDLLLSIDDFALASQFYKETCDIMQRAAMTIRKWNSNDPNLRSIFKEVNKPLSSQKVLGVMWNCLSDVLCLDLQEILRITPAIATKRIVLQLIARIYDPLGFLGPCTIKLKILFQEIWRRKLNGDETLPADLQTTWNICLAHLPFLEEFVLPRYVFSTSSLRINQQLHIFCDASLQAYGTVAYIRSQGEDGTVHVAYLCSKNRVAPLKNNDCKGLSLPKLELTAALIAARLLSYLITNLNVQFTSTYLWSDSSIALHWIRNYKHRNEQYVNQRTIEIRKLTNLSDWRHCPGESNPADLLTRGINGKVLLKSLAWINGPSWLLASPDYWPEQSSDLCVGDHLLCMQMTCEPQDKTPRSPLFKIEDFSSYMRVIRVTAYIQRFVESAKGRRNTYKFLTALELKRAELLWIKFVQFNTFKEEIDALQGSKEIPKSSKILTLNPIIDENGVLRVGSRLLMAGYSYNESFPVILPKTSYFTTLLIVDVHERTLHSGVNIVLSRIREKYWIIKGRQGVKSVIKRCKLCQRYRGKPMSQPIAPLPRNRLAASRPFETTGVDFAGPLYVRVNEGESTQKVYIMLLTCAVVRAVHIEIVMDLTTESCLAALRRFFSRRGIPNTIISDNARTFKRASLELKLFGDIVQSEEFNNFVSSKGISWDFICERAPWWGGFWERLIKIVKDILKLAIGRSTLNLEQLYTFVTEAEWIINTRPLTYISDDPLDLSPLTPNHFINGFFSTSLSTGLLVATDSDLRAKWRDRLRFTFSFLKRFKTEYVQQLRSIHHSSKNFSSDVSIGDIVMVYDQSKPRLFWKLARIERVFPGRDGKVRSCEVRLHNGLRMRRPVQHLYPLEVRYSAAPEGVENVTLHLHE